MSFRIASSSDDSAAIKKYAKVPLYNANEIKNMEALVATSIAEGATVAYGGKQPQGAEFEKGHWFEPTILTNVTQDMTIVHKESFGPILPVLKFSEFDEVIRYANDSEFGLAAMVFTNDVNKIMKYIKQTREVKYVPDIKRSYKKD